MTEPSSVSIIVVSYDTKTLLHRCISSIYLGCQGPAIEVIVVDNDSKDGSADMVRECFPKAVLIQNPKNLGFAKAVNQGLESAKGDYLLLLNSDTKIVDGALQRAVEFLKSHPDAGMVGCKLLNADGSVQPSCESFLDLRGIFLETLFLEKLFSRSRFFGRMHMAYFGHDRVERVDYVKGAFLMIRREALNDIGLLDDNFFFYAEEMDWCYRAKQKGWEVYFTPDAEIVHYGGQSGDPISPRMFVQLHKARCQFYRKHRGPVEYAIAKSLMAIGALLRLTVWTPIALWRASFRRSELGFARKKVAAFLAAFLWHLGLPRK